MTRIVWSVSATIGLMASSAAAQRIVYGIGGSVVVPISDYAEIDKVGWGAGADFTYWLPSPHFGVRVEASYSQTRQKAGACCLTDHTTQIVGGTAGMVYAFGTEQHTWRPYGLAGLGVYRIRLSAPGFSPSSDTRVGFSAGAGLAYRLGSGNTRLFFEAEVTTITLNNVQFASVPLVIGLRFGSGGGDRQP